MRTFWRIDHENATLDANSDEDFLFTAIDHGFRHAHFATHTNQEFVLMFSLCDRDFSPDVPATLESIKQTNVGSLCKKPLETTALFVVPCK